MKDKIGITAPAFNMDNKLEKRFKDYLISSVSQSNLTCDIYLTKLESEVLHEESKQFSRSKALNSGIKELIDHGVDVIVCTDIDMIMPPKLLRYAYDKSISTNKNIFSMTRFIDEQEFNRFYPDWKIFIRRPAAHSGYGGFNAMTVEMWKKSGGWPEELFEWGYEDISFREKLISRDIDTITLINFPLLHINHPPRSNIQQQSQRRNVDAANLTDINTTNWLGV